MDNKEIFSEAVKRLDSEYHLIEVDWRDELPPKIVADCLKAKSLQPLHEPDYFWEGRRETAGYIAAHILEQFVDDETIFDSFHNSPEWDVLLDEIEERDVSNPAKETFEKSEIHGYLRLQSNYDVWCPFRMTGGINTEDDALNGIMAVLSLNPAKVRQTAESLGYPVNRRGRWRNLPGREGKEVVKYEDFVNCLAETPCCGSWTFVGKFDMKALYESRCDTREMVIPEKTCCIIFNPWDGSGSYQPIATIRPLAVKDIIRRQRRYLDCHYVVVDERDCGNGYTTASVYGEYLDESVFLS